MNQNTLHTYESPEISVVAIETEQTIMGGSTEELGIRYNDLEW